MGIGLHASKSRKFKMAASRRTFTLEEAVDLCSRTDDEGVSDIDSSTGGMSSSEESLLDEELQNSSDLEADLR